MQILGINEIGYEASNSVITTGRTLPWLQETSEFTAWSDWAVVYRDVYVLDQDNYLVGIYNLTEHDLADSSNAAALTDLLLDAAER